MEKQATLEEKEIKVLTLEDYAKEPEALVTRGEFISILQSLLGNIDQELMDSFKQVVRTANLVQIMFNVLESKGYLTMEDVQEAQKQMAKGLKEEGTNE
jgi:predicted rRNA methylase YqxC with S4 and FtsJ domains